MKIYLSKSSIFVKIITSVTLIIITLVALTLIATDKGYGFIGGTILIALIFGTLIYFYSKSLDKIILDKNMIILKKNIGQINIPKSDIIEVNRISFSNLTMTFGSKGVFGFIGNTMDGSVSFVKDRNKMLRITTQNKKYIFSSENADELVREIRSAEPIYKR